MNRFKLVKTIGTVGVIVSLVFVAFSINRNTEETRASQTNYFLDASRDIELAIAADNEWSRIVVKGRDRSEPLSETEQFRYDDYVIANIDLWKQMRGRHNNGLLTDLDIDEWDAYFIGWAKSYIFESDWQRLRWQYGSDQIVQVVQEAISANSVK